MNESIKIWSPSINETVTGIIAEFKTVTNNQQIFCIKGASGKVWLWHYPFRHQIIKSNIGYGARITLLHGRHTPARNSTAVYAVHTETPDTH